MKTMIHVFHGRKKNTSKEIKQKNGDIDVQQVRSRKNLEDFFTKSLPRKTFE